MADRPNLLVMLADQVRCDSLGCFGTTAARTPHLDALAAEGCRFHECYASAPTAAETRRHLEATDWREALAAAGYSVGPEDPEAAADWLRGAAAPFLSVVHLGKPEAEQPHPDIDAARLPKALIVEQAVDDRPQAVRHQAATIAPAGRDAWQHQRALHAAGVRQLDHRAGQLLAALESRRDASETLVVFMSLQGCMLGDHQLADDGVYFYDPQVRVPLIVRHRARFRAGLQSYALLQTHDLGPTLLAAAGLPYPSEPDSRGASFLHLADVPDPTFRELALCRHRPDDGAWSAMVRRGNYKLILYHTPAGDTIDGELFDAEHDWHELNSLWDMPEYWGIRLGLTERLVGSLMKG